MIRKEEDKGEERMFKVFWRVRGSTKYEEMNEAKEAVEVLDARRIKFKETEKIFEFDRVFEPDTDQETFYEETMHEYVDAFVNGTDVWIFTYGHPATGGSYSTYGGKDQPGIIPRFMEELFRKINSSDEDEKQRTVQTSICELFINKLYDLASKERTPLKFITHESGKGFVSGLSFKNVNDSNEALEHLDNWLGNRLGYSEACMNVLADRSSLIYTITLKNLNGISNEWKIITIWGPEKISKWGVPKGEQMRIWISINNAFSSLNNVIDNIIKNKDTKVFRDNLLTRILKNDFKKESKTAMIVTTFRTELYSKDILSTLKYGEKAMKISD